MELRHASRSVPAPRRALAEALAGNTGAGSVGEPVSVESIAELLAETAIPGQTSVIGLTGSVAAGKTTLCNAIAKHLRSTLHIEIVSTDGFLLPADILAARELEMRKGYPETYDRGQLSGALQRVRWGPVTFPGYSHRTYDRAPELDRTISRPDILLIEGLGLAPDATGRGLSQLLDVFIYLEADEQDLEAWFVGRFLDFWRAADGDVRSFYYRFRSLSEQQAEALARSVWAAVNLPNLREHVRLGAKAADLVLRKASDHSLLLATRDA